MVRWREDDTFGSRLLMECPLPFCYRVRNKDGSSGREVIEIDLYSV